MNKVTNTILWVILFFLLVPSSLAVASWNSLPGSHLFTVKLVMEQALVAVVPSAQAKGDLQIAYTERRFSEARRMLADQSSVQGLSYLNSQVGVTRDEITNTADPVVRKQLAQRYLASLQSVSTQLEEQKQLAVSHSQQIAINPQNATRGNALPVGAITTSTTTNTVPATTTEPQPPPDQVISLPPVTQITSAPAPQGDQGNVPPASMEVSITTSQQQINQTITEMEDIANGNDHRNDNKDNNGNQNNNDNNKGSDGNNKGKNDH